MYLLDLGAALLLGGRYSEAAETFRRALEKARDADKPAIMLDLAIAYFRQGMLDQAFELLRAGRELEPDDRDLQVVSGMVLLQAEKWHEARKLLEKITPRDDPLVLLNLGIALVLCGEPEAGKEKLEQVFSKLDEKHLHDLRVVKGLLDAQDYKKAIRLLHELMLPGTKDAATWRRVALGAEQTKDWKRAAQAWAEVLAREPNSLEARAHRGVALVFTGRHAEAEELLAPCFEEAPNSARVVAFLALARIGQGKLDEAAPLVARLEKLDPALARSVSAAMERRRRADSGRRGKGRRERRRRH